MEPLGPRADGARRGWRRRRPRRGAILPSHVPARVRGARRPASGRLRRARPRVLRHEGPGRQDRPPRDAVAPLDLRALTRRDYTLSCPTLFVVSRFTFEPTLT